MKRNHPIAYAVAAALLATAFVGCTVQQGGEPVSATDAVTTTAEVTTTAATTAATEVTVTAATTAVAEVTTTAAVTTAAVATESPKTEKSTEGMTQLAFLSENHSPKAAGDKVMENMICISSDAMKGAHDAQYVFANGKAYVVYEANDKQAGDLGTDAAEYSALAIVDLDTFTVESIEKFVCSGQVFANETLPAGSCFVPRVIRKDDATLRFFFASQADGRQARTYYVDYDLATETFDKNVYRLKLQTASGKVDLTPLAYITAFRAEGRACGTSTRGVYLFDIFDIGDTKYVALNNFNNGQNSLAKFNDTYDCIEIIGNIGSMTDTVKTTENGIIQLKDGTWMAILRNERGDKNYLFSYSKDGTDWSYPAAEDFVQKGTNSKPILARFGDYYLMGYNETSRKTFHLAYSTDAKNWTKLYTFVSPTTFQYPEFDLYDGQIYFSVTMGSKERICFGKLGTGGEGRQTLYRGSDRRRCGRNGGYCRF